MKKEQQFVKILKSGENRGFFYNKGETHEIDKWYKKDQVAILINGAYVTVTKDKDFGKEAKLCTNPYTIYELW